MIASSNNKCPIENVLNAVDKFIIGGADLDVQNHVGNTALHLAVTLNLTPIAKKLIESGAKLNIQNHKGQTAKMIAAESGNAELIDLFDNIANEADNAVDIIGDN